MLMAVALLFIASMLAVHASAPGRVAAQQLHMIIGLVVLVGVMIPNYQRIGSLSYIFLFGACLLLGAVLLASPIKGSHRWFLLPGTIAFQPSELAKPAFVLAVAWYLHFRKDCRTLGSLVVPFLITIIPMGMILVEPDLGTALLLPFTLYAMLIAAGARFRHLLLIAIIALVALPGFYPFMHTYQKQRIIAMFEQGQGTARQLRGDMYQQHQSKITEGSGGLWGQGLSGADHVRHGLLPEAYNDFIFAVVGNQWGFAGSAGVLLLYLAFYGAALEIAASTDEPFGRVMVVGLSSLIVMQAMINIAMTTGLCPVVGIALPFVSYGGSSLVTDMLAVGLMLNVSVRRSRRLGPRTVEYLSVSSRAGESFSGV